MDKAQAARRQLGTALSLYLEDRDPVSVHTLACAGAELAESLSVAAGTTPFRFFRTNEKGREITDQEFTRLRNLFANAFKHYSGRNGKDRQDDALLQGFSDVDNDERLFIGWFDYGCGGYPNPAEAHVFQAWFLALHPSKLDSPDGLSLRAGLDRAFPNLTRLPRDRQKKRLREQIARMKRDREMMNDSRVDRRPLILGLPQG